MTSLGDTHEELEREKREEAGGFGEHGHEHTREDTDDIQIEPQC